MSEHAIKEEEEPLPKEIQRVPVEEPLWDEDLPEETVSLADLEEEKRAAEKATETPIYNSGKAEYEEKTHINDEKKPQTQRDFEQSEDWEEITEEPEESPWDPKLDESVSPDPLAAASGSIYVPEEKKQIVTASGKVIEAETDLLKKKLESTRAAEAAASVPKADPFMAPRSSNEKYGSLRLQKKSHLRQLPKRSQNRK